MALTLSTIVFSTATRDSLRDKLLADIIAGSAPVLMLYVSNGGTLLATIPLDTGALPFTTSSPGLLTADVSPVPTVNGAATGVPTFWELRPDSGGAILASGVVAGGDTINSGQPVNLTSWTITISA